MFADFRPVAFRYSGNSSGALSHEISDRVFAVTIVAFAALCSAKALSKDKPSAVAYDLSKDKVAYIVTDAHLDTQWLYDIQRTTDEFVPNTLRQNFALFEKYPGYVFNFEAAYRYYLAKLHYPVEICA